MMLHEIINDLNIPEFQLIRHQVNLYFVEFGTGVEQCINLVFFLHICHRAFVFWKRERKLRQTGWCQEHFNYKLEHRLEEVT